MGGSGARQAGVKLTTMGIGTEFNEDLLIPLADATGGSAYYIEPPNRFRMLSVMSWVQSSGSLTATWSSTASLARLSCAAFTVSCRNWVSLTPVQTWKGVMPCPWEIMTPALRLRCCWRSSCHQGILAFIRLAQALLTWEDPTIQLERQNLRQDLVIEVVQESAGGLNEHVMNVVEKVGGFKMGTFALDQAQSAALTGEPQDKDAATMQLRQALPGC